jgi:hypothetical protein
VSVERKPRKKARSGTDSLFNIEEVFRNLEKFGLKKVPHSAFRREDREEKLQISPWGIQLLKKSRGRITRSW